LAIENSPWALAQAAVPARTIADMARRRRKGEYLTMQSIGGRCQLWGEKGGLPQAEYEGAIRIGEVEIPVAVLADGRRLITQSGMMLALGRARQAKGRQYYNSDVNMPAFLTAKNLKPFISKELEVTSSQIKFR